MAFNISYVYIAKDRFTAVSRRVAKAANKVKARLKGVKTQSQKTGNAFDALSAKAAALAALMATLLIFATPIKDAIAFESALADLNKVMEFKLPSGLQRMAKGLQDLSKEIPVTQIGLTEIATAGAQLGIVEKDILRFTETTSKVAIAFDLMPSEAGEAVAKLSNIWGLSIEEFEGVADTINLISNETASSASEIIRALKNKAASAGLAMGFTERETVALTSTFIQLGVNADRVGSIMASMSRRLTDAKVVGEEVAAAFARDPKNALIRILEHANTLDIVGKNKFLKQNFGEFSTQMGLVAATMKTKLVPTLDLATDRIAAAGSVQKEFAARSATTANKLTLLSNKTKIISTNLGTVLLPALVGIVTVVGFVAESVADLTEITGPLIPMVFAAAGAFALVAVATQVWALAQAHLNLQMLANPVGLVIAGIVALVVLVAFLIKKFKELGAVGVFKGIGQSIIDFILFPLRTALKIADAIGGVFGKDFGFEEKLQKFTRLERALRILEASKAGQTASFVDVAAITASPKAFEEFINFKPTAILDAPAPSQETRTQVDINLNAPPGVVQSTEARTTGPGRTSVGQNMALAGGL